MRLSALHRMLDEWIMKVSNQESVLNSTKEHLEAWNFTCFPTHKIKSGQDFFFNYCRFVANYGAPSLKYFARILFLFSTYIIWCALNVGGNIHNKHIQKYYVWILHIVMKICRISIQGSILQLGHVMKQQGDSLVSGWHFHTAHT
jgi:hypothetical protein